MIHLLGIRHHGAGSARNVVERLEQLQPDLIMVEGAPELNALTHWAGDSGLVPPVAVLGYNTENPAQACFYPFAEFSPEWQAMLFAKRNNIKLEMIDAPLFYFSKIENEEKVGKDPLSYLAEIDGFSNGEDWWDYRFERQNPNSNPETHFEAVFTVVKNLREAGLPSSLEKENIYREAFMRRQIRKAIKAKYRNIAIVCGAWHAPALMPDDFPEKNDETLLKSRFTPKIKTGVTWIPWTNSRLSVESQYGAGITAPAWYECQWSYPVDTAENWLTRVARLFRSKYRDVSTAHVIEAHRLSFALCSLRGRSLPNLTDLNEAVVSVMCGGDIQVFDQIMKELLVGEKIGTVPDTLPKHPLQLDFEMQAKKCRLVQQPIEKELGLDLRNALDLQRSILLYRLQALNIRWAHQTLVRSKGTFKEVWRISWSPEMMIQILEMGIWGSTVELAAMHYIQHQADESTEISKIASLIGEVIPADLLMLLEGLLEKIYDLAAVSTDIIELMATVPTIADVSRYGNVRKTDLKSMQQLTKGLTKRICVGLSYATFGLNEETAYKMFLLLRRVNDALRLMQDDALTEEWNATLLKIVYQRNTTPLLAGCICRLLLESKTLHGSEAARLMNMALSPGNATADAASWMEGFLEGSSKILLYDETLWNLINDWIEQLTDEGFTNALPVLRRAFSRFPPLERKKIGEKAMERNNVGGTVKSGYSEFDGQLALSGLPMTLKILGLEQQTV